MATASRPCSSTIGSSPASMVAKASTQSTSTNTSSRFTNGRRCQSGSSCNCFNVEPFGQMNPCENTSSISPLIRCTASDFSVTSRPQPASQRGHVLYASRVSSPSTAAMKPSCHDQLSQTESSPNSTTNQMENSTHRHRVLRQHRAKSPWRLDGPETRTSREHVVSGDGTE